ncbi:tyrosine-type recombinase/integrase [Streptomyces cinnamoneus]
MLCRKASDSRTTIHDLRHLSATISSNAGVPLTVVSKTLRHSTFSTTANVYSHLTTQAAREAIDAIDQTLTQADRLPNPTSDTRTATALRPHPAAAQPDVDHQTGHQHQDLPQNSPGSGEYVRPHCDHKPTEHQKGRSLNTRKRPPTCESRWSGRRDLNPRPLDPSQVDIQLDRHKPTQRVGFNVPQSGHCLPSRLACGPEMFPRRARSSTPPAATTRPPPPCCGVLLLGRSRSA